ncbi:asparagine synthase (glutamine-hydrolyzing) [Parapusillimonas sp. SGNA-6]|nr:asparagine synthase (glutamine-hydrolyzing) [Parapusillimonas sp. SGNA-6]
MCGITGFFSPSRGAIDRRAVAARMADTLAHRGPDDAGVWADEALGLTLAHRRLSVQDLSPAGHQPMLSACDRYVIAFNGEIYNHRDLRRQLEAAGQSPAWRGHADTETLLACFGAWGVEKTLQAAVGMFAIVLWDRQEKTLTLARDRFGEKPLYWGWQGNSLLFGSELKALKAHPSFRAGIDRGAIALLLRHGYIAAPHSIYEHIHKLPPGHYVSIDLGRQPEARMALPAPYWTLNEAVHAGMADPFEGDDASAVDAVERQLTASIRDQMLADVPLGAFLSGGVDSSVIVALMQSQSRRPVRSFTIGFEDQRYDEAVHAQAIARHLGTSHTELVVTAGDALATIPGLPDIYDEPFADSSQIPTLLVSRLARESVTVALSGDAGDELFGGYNTYRFAPALWRRFGRLPTSVRKAAAAGLTGVSTASWDSLIQPLNKFLPGRLRGVTGEKLHKLAGLMSVRSKEAFFRELSSHWRFPQHIVIDAVEPATLLNTPSTWPRTDSFEHWMMAVSAQTYMADDILPKIDRAAMSASLEVRVPMLDHRVVELAWRMPLSRKLRDGQGKWLLRQVLYRHVPRELIERPKKGFSIPLGAWLRGPLREWAEALLDEQRLRREAYFYPGPIHQAWRLHQEGKADCSERLWSILMFQSWLTQNH